jgi:hypothetical protein
MFLPLLLGAFLSFSPAQANAKAPAAENCVNDCRIEKKDDGSLYIGCQCTKKNPWSAKSKEIFFRTRLSGATPEEAKAIEQNLCATTKAPEDLSKVRPLTARPFCECVSTRANFKAVVQCHKTRTGSTLCLPRHLDEKQKRKPALFDYLSCVVDRANYRKPESCKAETCDKTKPACRGETELVNIADPGACCPVFVCRPKT